MINKNIIKYYSTMDLIGASHWKTTLCVNGSIFCGLAYKLWKTKVDRNNKCDINEVLFYGAGNKRKVREIGLDNLCCINYVLAHVSETIDVCVPSLESDTIAKSLINVQKRNGARIRVAIHKSDNCNYLESFAETSIEVKVIKAEKLEYEFILLDAKKDANEAVAIIGSLDYETSRVNCNRDTTLLTSEVAVIKSLKKEFERVWNSQL